MSGRRARGADPLPAPWRVPPTISRRALFIDGSDRTAQTLIYDLLALATSLIVLRNVVAGRLTISGPQYSILMAVGRFQAARGIRVGAIAKLLSVSPAFVTTEVGKLTALRLLFKRRNPQDRREVLLTVSLEGQRLIEEHATLVRWMNDRLFAGVSAEEFRRLSGLADRMVRNTTRSVQRLRQSENPALLSALGEPDSRFRPAGARGSRLRAPGDRR